MSNASTTTPRNIDPDDPHHASKRSGKISGDSTEKLKDSSLAQLHGPVQISCETSSTSSSGRSKTSRKGKVLERRGASGAPVTPLAWKLAETPSTSIVSEESRPFVPPLSIERVMSYRQAHGDCELQKGYTVDSPCSRASSPPPSDDGRAGEVATSAGFKLLAEVTLDKAVDKLLQQPPSQRPQSARSWVEWPDWTHGLLSSSASASRVGARVTFV